jgi:RIP metalloprotease RseP
VFAAGPFMNLVLGIALYAVVAAIGAEVPETKVDNRIGAIEPGSPAASAPLYRIVSGAGSIDTSGQPDAVGWETGDRILYINKDKVTSITDVAFDAILGAGSVLEVVVERTGRDGTVTRYVSPVEPKKPKNGKHVRFGVAPFVSAWVARVQDGSPAAEAGVQAGDTITRLNGKLVDTDTFVDGLGGLSNGEVVELELERGSETIATKARARRIGRFEGITFYPPHNWTSLFRESLDLEVLYEDDEFETETGLRPGHRIVKIDGESATSARIVEQYEMQPDVPVSVLVESPGRMTGLLGSGQAATIKVTGEQLAQAVTSFDLRGPPVVFSIEDSVADETGLKCEDIIVEVDGQPATAAVLGHLAQTRMGEQLELTVERPAIAWGILRDEEELTASLPVHEAGEVGVVLTTKYVFHRVPAAQVVPEAFRLGYQALARTMKTLWLLITGTLSPRDLGGPVMIFQVTTEAARLGYSWLIEITAFISINLCVFNLLPLPVLDGGHLAIMGLEAVRRKPIAPKVLERVQQFGLLFILALLLFITVNDITRVVTKMLP